MTNRVQYRLSTLIFVIFACGIFLLLVDDHQEVAATLDSLHVPIIPKSILTETVRRRNCVRTPESSA